MITLCGNEVIKHERILGIFGKIELTSGRE